MPLAWIAPKELWEPAPQPGSTDELQGAVILVIGNVGAGNRRKLASIKSSGARLLCYNDTIPPWASERLDLISEGDWILGPAVAADATLEESSRVVGAVQDWMKKAGDAVNITGLLCMIEDALLLTAQVAQELGLPPQAISKPHVVKNVRDKYNFREACVAAHIPSPKFLKLEGGLPAVLESGQLPRMLAECGIRFPVVTKPCCYPKSFSVRWESLEHIQQVASQSDIWSSLLSRWKDHGDMLMEEVIEGVEVDIDCIVYRGQLVFACVSDNYESLTSTAGADPKPSSESKSLGLMSFVERGGCLPSKLSESAQTQLLHLAADVSSMFGADMTAVIHFEAKYNDGAKGDAPAAVPIELNLRVAGAETFTNMKTTWGVDLAQAAARLGCGLRPVLPDVLKSGAEASSAACSGTASERRRWVQDVPVQAYVSSSNFVPRDWVGAGVVEKLELGELGLADPAYVDHEVYFQKGAVARLPPAGFVGLGWMVAQSPKSVEDAEAALERVSSHLVIQLRKPEPSELV